MSDPHDTPVTPSQAEGRGAGGLFALALTDLPEAGNYRAGQEIARGGMGAVLRAQDQKLGRTVAMKVMLSTTASASSWKPACSAAWHTRTLCRCMISGWMPRDGTSTP